METKMKLDSPWSGMLESKRTNNNGRSAGEIIRFAIVLRLTPSFSLSLSLLLRLFL